VTELAIFAVSSAGVTITVAIAIFILGRRAADAERRAGDMGVKASNLDGKLLAATTSAERWKEAAQEANAKVIKMSDLIARVAKDLPPDGARARMHAAWFEIHNPGTVPTTGPAPVAGEIVRGAEAKAPGPDDLIDPNADS
jgi:hypothetical protein